MLFERFLYQLLDLKRQELMVVLEQDLISIEVREYLGRVVTQMECLESMKYLMVLNLMEQQIVEMYWK